jgi:hypothetical protein
MTCFQAGPLQLPVAGDARRRDSPDGARRSSGARPARAPPGRRARGTADRLVVAGHITSPARVRRGPGEVGHRPDGRGRSGNQRIGRACRRSSSRRQRHSTSASRWRSWPGCPHPARHRRGRSRRARQPWAASDRAAGQSGADTAASTSTTAASSGTWLMAARRGVNAPLRSSRCARRRASRHHGCVPAAGAGRRRPRPVDEERGVRGA